METNPQIDNFIKKLKSVKELTIKASIITHMMDMNDDELRIIFNNIIKIKKQRNLCPNCETTLIHESGCEKCHNCGFTSCEL
jgi:recombinational DNA repair protein RecR